MNFIFDIGNVLVDFKPDLFLREMFAEQGTIDTISETIFKSREWILMDEGLLTHEEASAIFCKREPDLKAEIIHTMQKLCEMLTPMFATVDLLPKVKERGYGLYYLSNYHNELRNYILKEYQFFSLFDGGVFSCDVNMIKPSSEIYRYLLEKYQLDPSKCLFFDDLEENVAAAKKEGINGILFTGAECVLPFVTGAIAQ